jgi:ribosomal protein S27AE
MNPNAHLKIYARQQSAYAIKTGKLVRQPCEQCGKAKSEAHHDDYSKPLTVRWLCRPHHGAVHRKSHCPRGHAYTSTNRIAGGSCRECAALRYREKRATLHGSEATQ